MCSKLTQPEEIEPALKEIGVVHGAPDAPQRESAGCDKKPKRSVMVCYTSAYRAAYMKSHSNDYPQPVSDVTRSWPTQENDHELL